MLEVREGAIMCVHGPVSATPAGSYPWSASPENIGLLTRALSRRADHATRREHSPCRLYSTSERIASDMELLTAVHRTAYHSKILRLKEKAVATPRAFKWENGYIGDIVNAWKTTQQFPLWQSC